MKSILSFQTILCLRRKILMFEKVFSNKSMNSWCLLLVLKSILMFCVNPSFGLVDKSLFANELVFSKFSFFYEFSQLYHKNFAFDFPWKILYTLQSFCFICMISIFFLIFAFILKTDWSKILRKREIFCLFREQAKFLRKNFSFSLATLA